MRKAGEQEFSEAQYNLSVIYFEGKSMPQDYAQAVSWYLKAAELCYGTK